jgi:hypothetical protein
MALLKDKILTRLIEFDLRCYLAQGKAYFAHGFYLTYSNKHCGTFIEAGSLKQHLRNLGIPKKSNVENVASPPAESIFWGGWARTREIQAVNPKFWDAKGLR